MAVQSKPLPTLSPLGKAAAGALAAMVANTLVYPIDLAKTRLQVQIKSDNPTEEPQYKNSVDVIRKIYKASGVRGLYAGLLGTLLGVASTNFAYFYWYSVVRGAYIKRQPGKALTTAAELLLGALAGALAQLFTIPVSVITTRQQTTNGSLGLLATAHEVVAEDGPSGLWRGLKASLILVINPSITYGSASRIKALLFGETGALSVPQNFLLGALSKSMATVATQPMIVAKVMLQSSKKPKNESGSESEKGSRAGHPKVVFRTFGDALAYLWREEGFKGLFKGLGPQLFKGILVQGILLACKDKTELALSLMLQLVRLRAAAAKARPVLI